MHNLYKKVFVWKILVTLIKIPWNFSVFIDFCKIVNKCMTQSFELDTLMETFTKEIYYSIIYYNQISFDFFTNYFPKLEANQISFEC